MKHKLSILLFILAQSCATPIFAQSLDPLLYAGANFDQAGRTHAAAEVWFAKRGFPATAVQVLGGIKPDGTIKLGTGYAVMGGDDVGTFVFADVRAWAYLETSAGGDGGGGLDGGLGVAMMRMLFRVGYGLSGTTNHPRQRGFTGMISIRLYPE